MYDFSNEAITAEHADVTFKKMEDEFPSIRQELLTDQFVNWEHHREFLLIYMQMMRVRSPQFFVEQGEELVDATVATITGVDHQQNKITYDNVRKLTHDEIHDHTLAKMREEFHKGTAWMKDFHWQIRTTFDPRDPVITSEQPLFVRGTKPQTERAMTMDILSDEQTEIWFPLFWQAAIVGRSQPFERNLVSFETSGLRELQHIVAETAPETVISPQIVDHLVLDGRNRPTQKSRGA
jgi:Protein of unknown function (DUF4238)